MNPHPSKPFVHRERGFALLITITLLAFLVLLLVSLASLTRVETQVAANSQQLSQARQNALMALNIAIGQLQKYAGPDQRTTARADIDATLERQPNSRWTGVYGSSIAANYSDSPSTIATALTDPTKVNATTGSSAKLLNWLVSGNEDTPFNPSTGVGASGEITSPPAANTIPYDPTKTIANLTASTPASADNITIGGKAAQLLVAAGSTNTDLPLTGTSTNVPVDYVVAPLVPIKVASAQVPGLDPAGSDVSVGRYAWWVGDEGIKARINLPRQSSTDLTELNNAFVTPTRSAIELMAGTTSTATSGPVTGVTDTTIGALSYDIDKAVSAVSRNQLPLLNSGSTTLGTFTQNRFHDLTANSYGVLSDTYAGGLRKDLTRLLIDGQTTTGTANSDTLFTAESSAGTDNYIPNWGLLRNYTQLTTASDGSLAPRLPTPQQAGISPVLTYFSLGWRFATVGPRADGANITLNLYPLVVLWNPYTVPIKVPSGYYYEVGIYPTYSVTVTLQVADAAGTTWTTKDTRNFQRITQTGTSSEYIRFRLDCPEIAPGESLVFALRNSGAAYTSSNILENVAPNPTHYVTLPSSTIGTGESSRNYKVVSASGGSGSSFGAGGGGEMYTYLGEASSNSATSDFDSQHDPFSTSKVKKWFQANQRIGWDSIQVANSIQQSGLNDGAGESPAFIMLMQALFSGWGSNGINGTLPSQHNLPTRWIAQGNMRAPITSRTRRDANFNVLFSATAGIEGGSVPWQNFVTAPPGTSTSAGRGHDWISNTPEKVTLFEVRDHSQPNILSIGQLQQAPLSAVGAYPSYPLGNSLADFRLKWNQLVETVNIQDPYSKELASRQKAYYDVSWLLNRTFWNRYFFSTVPASGAPPATLPNPRLVYNGTPSAAILQDADKAAAGLLIAGGFNINSTSEQAWRAVLGGAGRLGYDPVTNSTGTTPPAGGSASSPIPRFSHPTADDSPNAGWQGYRALTEVQIAQLARDIVEQVRLRGPFVSLSDFINRRLVDTSTNDRGIRGTLQAAIDRHTTSSASTPAVNDASSGTFWNDASVNDSVENVIKATDKQSHFINNHSWGNLGAATNGVSNRAAYAPKYLTQADILSSIGPSISARSDTFLIRAYGDVLNPVTSTTSSPVVNGRAWCEAIVQRMPEYVDTATNAWDAPATGSLNAIFGRRFKIISFRWLSPSEI
jgi:hypothetical protein